MRKGKDFRFVVSSGQHRSGAVSACKISQVPVSFSRQFPRFIDCDAIYEWPSVIRGDISHKTAADIIDIFFAKKP